jgi:hypothetical protein
MTETARNRWIVFHIVKWWSAAALMATGIVIVDLLVDGIGRVGWSYARYALPFALALALVVWLTQEVAISSLRSLQEKADQH